MRHPALAEYCIGSSPLARGTPSSPGEPTTGDRFIPARAGNTGGSRPRRSLSAVHPRSRGEHCTGQPVSAVLGGSSPLARGTPPCRRAPLHPGRFIPARAGNTSPRPPLRSSEPVSSPLARGTRRRPEIRGVVPTVHPRSRGEHRSSNNHGPRGAGSSPLARGTPASPVQQARQRRFIPARAGNTPPRSRPRSATPVHPRSRGEHHTGRSQGQAGSGSSPLARGTRTGAGRPSRLRRFIPARAGNTRLDTGCTGSATVHPRSRGEHGSGTGEDVAKRGSSPLARGTPPPCRPTRPIERFIPARAGNTLRFEGRQDRAAVHPRSRGEHGRRVSLVESLPGSSPLARGTQPRIGASFPVLRFIPARAGNTEAAPVGSIRPSVHPRSRGEHSPRAVRSTCLYGSSPLARGTQRPEAACTGPGRFIPARAGNTAGQAIPSGGGAVHPRSRGEHPGGEVGGAHRHRFIPARAGNTTGVRPGRQRRPVHPRSRGEHGTPAGVESRASRFIPARAGNTRAICLSSCSAAVHPRSRGEHASPPSTTISASGSSPLARGTRRPSSRAEPGSTVHPRSRGEHTLTSRTASSITGSSPLARGTRRPVRSLSRPGRFIPARAGNTQPGGGEQGALQRFIPARAGNTRGCPAAGAAQPVHPRSRGEHCPVQYGLTAGSGSSPLARGTRAVVVSSPKFPGIWGVELRVIV